MNRNELIKNVANLLRENNVKKPVSMPKQVLRVSDDEGNKKDFVLQKTDKRVLYTVEDIDAIIGACQQVICDSLKRGEPISIHGFGKLELKYHKPTSIKHVETGEKLTIEERYVPKFSFGNDLRLCAKIYELSLEDKAMAEESIPSIDDMEEDL